MEFDITNRYMICKLVAKQIWSITLRNLSRNVVLNSTVTNFVNFVIISALFSLDVYNPSPQLATKIFMSRANAEETIWRRISVYVFTNIQLIIQFCTKNDSWIFRTVLCSSCQIPYCHYAMLLIQSPFFRITFSETVKEKSVNRQNSAKKM